MLPILEEKSVVTAIGANLECADLPHNDWSIANYATPEAG
jgi:hypothetical protein